MLLTLPGFQGINNVFNIWLINHINPYFIPIIIMMDKISSDLHGVGINYKTTQPRAVYNSIHQDADYARFINKRQSV